MDKAQKDRVLEACETLTYMECPCCYDQGMYNLTQLILFPEDLPIFAAEVREWMREDGASETEAITIEPLLDTCAEVCRQFIYLYDDFEEIHEQARLNALGALIILGRFDIIQKLPAWCTYFRAKEV